MKWVFDVSFSAIPTSVSCVSDLWYYKILNGHAGEVLQTQMLMLKAAPTAWDSYVQCHVRTSDH